MKWIADLPSSPEKIEYLYCIQEHEFWRKKRADAKLALKRTIHAYKKASPVDRRRRALGAASRRLAGEDWTSIATELTNHNRGGPGVHSQTAREIVRHEAWRCLFTRHAGTRSQTDYDEIADKVRELWNGGKLCPELLDLFRETATDMRTE